MKIGRYQMTVRLTFVGLTLDEAGVMERYLAEGLQGRGSPVKAENILTELTQIGEKRVGAPKDDDESKK